MTHTRNKEQAEELFCFLLRALQLFHAVIVRDSVNGADHRVLPTLIGKRLAAARLESPDVCIYLVNHGADLRLRTREVLIEVKAPPVPLWIIEDPMSPEVGARGFRCPPVPVPPEDGEAVAPAGQRLAALRPARINLFASAWVFGAGVHFLQRRELRCGQAIVRVSIAAEKNQGVEVAGSRIVNDPIYQAATRVACPTYRPV